MELEEALAEIETLKAKNQTLTGELSTARGDLIKANNRIVNMDSANGEAYDRGVADGRQEHQLKEAAKRLNINTDSPGDINPLSKPSSRKPTPK